MMDYPENHLCHSDSPDSAMVGGMFPVAYGWDECEAVRNCALALGLPEGCEVAVWVSLFCPVDGTLYIDAYAIGRADQAEDWEHVRFDEHPEIDFTEVRRCAAADVLRLLPEDGIDVAGVVSALDIETGDA